MTDTFRSVGLVLFEDADGHLTAQATYTKHYLLRPPELLFQGLYYHQNRQDGGVWVYRQSGSTTAGSPLVSDSALTDIAPATEPVTPEPPSPLTLLEQRIAALEMTVTSLTTPRGVPTSPTEPSDG